MEVDPMIDANEKQGGSLGRRVSGSSGEGGYQKYHKRDGIRERGKFPKVSNHEHYHHTDSHASRKKEHSHILDNKHDKDNDHKADVAKSAVSVSGDWSEHISSSGKRYYYNCKTEVSQWKKPKDWIEYNKSDSRSRDSDRYHDGPKKSIQGHESKHRHSDDGDRSDGYHASNTGPKDYRKLGHHVTERSPKHKNSNGGDSLHSNSDSKWNKCGNNIDTYYNRHRKEQHPNRYHNEQSNCDRSVNQRMGHLNSATSGFHPAGPRDVHTTVPSRIQNQNEDSHHTEDMDISPRNTPNSSASSSRTASQIPGHLVGHPTCTSSHQQDTTISPNLVTSSLIQHLGDKKFKSSDSQNLTQQALETLKKLQEAITSTLKYDQKCDKPRTTAQQSPRCADMTSPAQQIHQSPEIVLPSNVPREEQQPSGSPRSEENIPLSGHASPAHSQGSSQGEDNASNCVLTTGIKPPPVHLTPSLTNYYNNDLTVHLSGWPADRVEEQANQCGEEGTTVGNLHCTQVSADLKTARSLVRVAESQATLYEQRILLINQEIKDLGNLRTQNAFLSAEDT